MKRRLLAFVVLASAASAFARPHAERTANGAQSVTPANSVEDEYVRYELLQPSTNTMRISDDVSVVTAGATTYTDVVPAGAEIADVSVIDLMTGTPLTFHRTASRLEIALARPVPNG